MGGSGQTAETAQMAEMVETIEIKYSRDIAPLLLCLTLDSRISKFPDV